MRQLPTDTGSAGASRKKEVVRLWLRLSSCERSIEQRLRSHLSESFDVTLPQFEVLWELDSCDSPVVMSRLSEQLKVTGSNLTGVVDRLERKGLVERFRSSTDRRVQRIEMTPAGRTAFAEIAADNALWVARAFTELTDKEVIQLQKLLLKASLSVTKAMT
jgi:DNA-binding MarR family transcriptional regulator